MSKEKPIKIDLEKGKQPMVIGFEAGYKVCIESVSDKGYNELVLKLAEELKKIKAL